MSDIRRWESAVLAEPGAAERVADIEAELREVARGRSTPMRQIDVQATDDVQTDAQATDDINSEGV